MRRIYCIILLISGLQLHAQDPNFSQFFSSPLTLNPALTGKFDGVLRVAGNYRNQWPTINNAFITGTASMDFGILKNAIPEFDQFGVGIMALSDKSGNGAIQNNNLSLSTAYHKSLDENGYHQIGLGFQGTFVNKRLDPTKFYFEDQLTANGWTGITSEIFMQDQVSVSYYDMNIGLLYTGSDGTNNFYFGTSMYHVNRPKESFQGGQFHLDPRVTFQGGGTLPMGMFDAFHFSAIHSRQNNHINTVFGGAYMLNLNADQTVPMNLYVGSWFRLKDAVIPYVGLEFGDFHLGATYDVNTSSLKPASNLRGGTEISLIYIKRQSDPYAKRLYCPKF
ncbi:MAG TPA: PorP/SprF family type IX secretion system membrane protein [Flavisolibacter sp.]|nr:PorP/SprF family type IX secretion system membrane protein [Flavisolibacter sp.]